MSGKKDEAAGLRRSLERVAKRTVLLAGAILAALVVAVAALTPDCSDEGCPTLATVQSYTPPEPARVYDRHGELVGQLPGPRRLVVELDEISPLIRNGFVAVEDRRFFRHHGIDPAGIVRALFRNLRSGSVEEGASTITMQLVRNVFGPDVREYNRWRRKLTEARMALALEDRLPKERLLELYLNQIYLGDGAWGVETAARSLFGKSASEVTAAEAALIVGLAKNPEGYGPRRHPERAVARRDVVLGVMEREGLLDPAEAERARIEELELAPRAVGDDVATWYLAAVDRRVRTLYPDPRERDGLRLHTGYDPALQRAATEELIRQIERVEGGALGAWRHPVPSGELTASPGAASPYLQGMVVSLDAETGRIRALVGGRDFEHSEFDRALQARRQPGSAFKPVVYAAGLAGGLTLLDTVSTGELTLRRAGSAAWSPREGEAEGPLTLRRALATSSNRAAVRVGRRAGVQAVVRQARDLGIETPIPPYPSIFLGSAEVVPVELAAAYAAFGNGGRRVVPHLLVRIEDRGGTVVWRPEGVEPVPVLDPAIAYLTLDALRDVVDEGTARSVRTVGYGGPAAGKTGTTDEGRDAWFVGLVPGLSTAVWLGFDAPRPIGPGAGGGSLAAPVWGRMMEAVEDEVEEASWAPPPGVVEVPVDLSTGARASGHCPEEVVGTELFVRGTEPEVVCPVHEGGFFDRLLDGVKSLFGGDG